MNMTSVTPMPSPPQAAAVLSRHRGPYSLLLVRADAKGLIACEWLRGRVDADSLEAEARALLIDPRDTILRVHAWSERERQFVMTWRRGEVQA